MKAIGSALGGDVQDARASTELSRYVGRLDLELLRKIRRRVYRSGQKAARRDGDIHAINHGNRLRSKTAVDFERQPALVGNAAQLGAAAFKTMV